jgi:hypothetical protein
MATGRSSQLTVKAVDVRSRVGLASSLHELASLESIKIRLECADPASTSTVDVDAFDAMPTHLEDFPSRNFFDSLTFEEIVLQLNLVVRTVKRLDGGLRMAASELSLSRDDS